MENKTQDFNAIDLIDFIWKYKKVFIIIGIVAAAVSSAVSLVMEERYLSTVTLYPTKASAVTFSEVIMEDQSVSKFGEEEEAEQMLQILGSEPIRNSVIASFDLMKHYDIKEDDKFKNTTLFPEVKENCMSTAFSHIFQGGYSSGYYSYKWAEVLDADAFEYFEEAGVFNKNVATKFKDNVLSKGGTENPMTLYKRFRGKEPKPEALLKRAGLLK